MEGIENKVAASGLITIDLEDFLSSETFNTVDIKPWLFMEQILREKDFRVYIKEHNWAQYTGQNIGVFCSADAIVPTWAYMLVALAIEPFAKTFCFGDLAKIKEQIVLEKISALNAEDFQDAKVVIKGCSKEDISTMAYVAIVKKLKPVVASFMYGEPCSTVPLYKRKKIEA